MASRMGAKAVPFVSLALAVVALGGCIKIEVIDRASSGLELAPAEGAYVAEHDLAVLAVDFDPPLRYEEIVARRARGEGITLLVAVENTGASTERDVVVNVQLSELGGETVFLHKQGAVSSIAPGEVKIVQFRDTEIPFSYTYLLDVSVAPVTGETHTSDNQRSYDLLITQP